MRTAVDWATRAPISQDVMAAVVAAGTRDQRSYADLYLGGTLIESGIPVVAGEVSWDRSQLVRSSCRVQIAGADRPDLVRLAASGLLGSAGYELRLWHGLMLPGGAVGMVPLGWYGISGRSRVGMTDRMIDVEGWDRSRRIDRSLIILGSVIFDPLLGTLESQVEPMLRVAAPDIGIEFAGDTHSAPNVTMIERWASPWATAVRMATGAGCEIVITSDDGRVLWRPEPALTGDPAVTWTHGVNIIDGTIEVDGDQVANYVEATSDAANATELVGTATNTNPMSPTRFGGPAGILPRRVTSPLWTTQQHVIDAAATTLAASDMGALTASLSVPADPRIETSDAARIVWADAGVDVRMLVQQVRLPLGADPVMTVTARSAEALDAE